MLEHRRDSKKEVTNMTVTTSARRRVVTVRIKFGGLTITIEFPYRP